MTSNNTISPAILHLLFLKKSRNTRNSDKLRPEIMLIHALLSEFLEFVEDNGKMRNYVKKFDFWPKLHENCSCLGNVKQDGHKIGIHVSKFCKG